ncbi:MAG TPA: aspartate aminotransferase family protein [Candidatus Limnocylindria bacterium]|nr:aspartate aminotransferase family protein [Candidatus Limnocylindria bacterium]
MKIATQKTLDLLRTYESRNVTFVESDGSWPIVWERARGVHVWDAEGKKYLDLTAAFGVAAAGHANPRVVRAGQKQMAKLMHAMGDVHPHALKAELARELSRITFERWARLRESSGMNVKFPAHAKTIFCNSGFEAVEAGLKTAMLATGKSRVLAFEGAYHGLGYGTLNATHRGIFRSPFREQLVEFADFLPVPKCDLCECPPGPCGNAELIRQQAEQLLKSKRFGAVIVEPVQARGGIRIIHAPLLNWLRQLCSQYGALLIFDEVYSGFGRTGKWFASEHGATVPDLICLGKALTGGFPLSACVGRADVMDKAWPLSKGEAIHTSTFLGHPVGCAMALANIQEIREHKLVERSARLGKMLLSELSKLQNLKSKVICRPRGIGLMAGLELLNPDGSPATELSLHAIKKLLHRGFLFLPEGEHANVISFTPPLTISERQLHHAVTELRKALAL